MDDQKIIELYFARSEDAISETNRKYGKYCHTVAYRILGSNEDAEECVNDTWLRTWNSIPPHRPSVLSAFLAKITRSIALDRIDYYKAQKRPQNVVSIVEELRECAPNDDDMLSEIALRDSLNDFLEGLEGRQRTVFMQRYWFFCSVADISRNLGISKSNVKVILHRTRNELRAHLEKDGFYF